MKKSAQKNNGARALRGFLSASVIAFMGIATVFAAPSGPAPGGQVKPSFNGLNITSDVTNLNPELSILPSFANMPAGPYIVNPNPNAQMHLLSTGGYNFHDGILLVNSLGISGNGLFIPVKSSFGILDNSNNGLMIDKMGNVKKVVNGLPEVNASANIFAPQIYTPLDIHKNDANGPSVLKIDANGVFSNPKAQVFVKQNGVLTGFSVMDCTDSGGIFANLDQNNSVCNYPLQVNSAAGFNSTSNGNLGVYGEAKAANGVGVSGESNAQGGIGVKGRADQGVGVLGQGQIVGVSGLSLGNNGAGVSGSASMPSSVGGSFGNLNKPLQKVNLGTSTNVMHVIGGDILGDGVDDSQNPAVTQDHGVNLTLKQGKKDGGNIEVLSKNDPHSFGVGAVGNIYASNSISTSDNVIAQAVLPDLTTALGLTYGGNLMALGTTLVNGVNTPATKPVLETKNGGAIYSSRLLWTLGNIVSGATHNFAANETGSIYANNNVTAAGNIAALSPGFNHNFAANETGSIYASNHVRAFGGFGNVYTKNGVSASVLAVNGTGGFTHKLQSVSCNMVKDRMLSCGATNVGGFNIGLVATLINKGDNVNVPDSCNVDITASADNNSTIMKPYVVCWNPNGVAW